MDLQDFIKIPDLILGQCTAKSTARIKQIDLDILVEATNGNCGIALHMRENNNKMKHLIGRILFI